MSVFSTSLLAVSLKTGAVSFLSSPQQYAWYRVTSSWLLIKLMNKQMKSQRVKSQYYQGSYATHHLFSMRRSKREPCRGQKAGSGTGEMVAYGRVRQIDGQRPTSVRCGPELCALDSAFQSFTIPAPFPQRGDWLSPHLPPPTSSTCETDPCD